MYWFVRPSISISGAVRKEVWLKITGTEVFSQKRIKGESRVVGEGCEFCDLGRCGVVVWEIPDREGVGMCEDGCRAWCLELC
jgi:hypothetical protein